MRGKTCVDAMSNTLNLEGLYTINILMSTIAN